MADAAAGIHCRAGRHGGVAARGGGAAADNAVVGFAHSGPADASAGWVAAFRKGLGETGYVEGQNVAVEYRWGGGAIRSPAGADG
jgi:hypothetical protein